jgi:hypothetical protein
MKAKLSCNRRPSPKRGGPGHPRTRVTALIRIAHKSPPAELLKPGWPRWDEAMSALTGILIDLEAEMSSYARACADQPSQHWQGAFRKRIADTLAAANDPFFDL